MNYNFKEKEIMQDVMNYIDDTYGSHYAQSKRQATEIIIDQGHGTGFCMGNILKYAQRYGKKDGKNKKDLMKVIHYAVIQLSQDHYKNEKSVYESLNDDMKQYDLWNTNTSKTAPLRSVMSEKYNKENI